MSTDPQPGPPAPLWTQDDVEICAQAACDGRIPPLEVMLRLGHNPPRDYLHALGARITEMAEARKLLLSRIVQAHENMRQAAEDYATLYEMADDLGDVPGFDEFRDQA